MGYGFEVVFDMRISGRQSPIVMGYLILLTGIQVDSLEYVDNAEWGGGVVLVYSITLVSSSR